MWQWMQARKDETKNQMFQSPHDTLEMHESLELQLMKYNLKEGGEGETIATWDDFWHCGWKPHPH